jgi:hypothetical protein
MIKVPFIQSPDPLRQSGKMEIEKNIVPGKTALSVKNGCLKTID